MGVNHGRVHIALFQQSLNSSNVGARLCQVHGKAVAQGVHEKSNRIDVRLLGIEAYTADQASTPVMDRAGASYCKTGLVGVTANLCPLKP